MNDAEVALSAASAAAVIIRQRFGGTLTRIDKGESDFATDVDLDAERAILDILISNRPTDRIIAEESGASGDMSSIRSARLSTGPMAQMLGIGAKVK